MSQPLVLALHTLPKASLAEQFQAAARAEFDGVAFWASQVEADRAAGHTLEELRGSAAGHGLEVAQLEVASKWADGVAAREAADAEAAQLLDFADALGAKALLAATLMPGALDAAEAAAGFARLCDQASERGVEVNLEFLPWTAIDDLAAAFDIVRVAHRANGGLLIDTWHWFRSGGSHDDLRKVPAEAIRAVQLNDAPRAAESNLIDETLHRRLLPGHGDIGVVEFIRSIDEMGVSCPIHAEVFSDDIVSMSVCEAADQLGGALRSVLAEARASGA